MQRQKPSRTHLFDLDRGVGRQVAFLMDELEAAHAVRVMAAAIATQVRRVDLTVDTHGKVLVVAVVV